MTRRKRRMSLEKRPIDLSCTSRPPPPPDRARVPDSIYIVFRSKNYLILLCLTRYLSKCPCFHKNRRVFCIGGGIFLEKLLRNRSRSPPTPINNPKNHSFCQKLPKKPCLTVDMFLSRGYDL